MNLLKAWQDSLDIFRPANFKLFLLVTLHSAWQSYKILFKYFWWLIMLSAFGLSMGSWFFARAPLFAATIVKAHPILTLITIPVLALSGWFVSWFAVLASRASTKKKDFSYFFSYTGHFLFYLLGTILLMIAALFMVVLPLFFVSFFTSIGLFGLLQKIIRISFVGYIVPCLSVLFFVDGSAGIGSYFYCNRSCI